jgi:hypothetical protein
MLRIAADTFASAEAYSNSELGLAFAAFRRLQLQLEALLGVLGYAPAITISFPECMQRGQVTMPGGSAKPRDSTTVIPGNANALMVEDSDVVFSISVACFGCSEIVLKRKAPVGSRSVTVVVDVTQPLVGFDTSYPGSPF